MHYKKRSSEFCIIAPTNELACTLKSKSHLVLAHLVDTDPVYANFYANLDDTHFIIMDNGAFELGASYDPDKLIELATKCGADVIVLPDFPGQPSIKTITESERIIDKVMQAGFLTMFVPQSKCNDLDDWIVAYSYAAYNEKIDLIGMSILGIPNALPHIDRSFARVVMSQILIERGLFNFSKHHHYLGLNTGPKLEIPSLLKMGALDTCDSSNPVWTAILGHEYSTNTDSFLSTIKPKLHVDFKLPKVTDQLTLDRINHNIDLTLSLFK